MISTDIEIWQGPDNLHVSTADLEEQGKANDRRKSRFLVELPPELREAVERAAFANERPRNSEIVLRLRQSFEADARQVRPAIGGWLAGSASEMTAEEKLLLLRFKALSADQKAALLTLLG